MNISTKGRYGLRALLDLSINAKENVVTLASIAERQTISEGYLAKIVTGLKGPQGGYLLSRPPKEIKIKHVLETLEGDLFSVKEEITNNPVADAMEHCIHHVIWKPLLAALTKANETLTLQDLIDEFEIESGSLSPMYFI